MSPVELIKTIETTIMRHLKTANVPTTGVSVDPDSLRQISNDWWAVDVITPQSLAISIPYYDSLVDAEEELVDAGIRVVLIAA